MSDEDGIPGSEHRPHSDPTPWYGHAAVPDPTAPFPPSTPETAPFETLPPETSGSEGYGPTPYWPRPAGAPLWPTPAMGEWRAYEGPGATGYGEAAGTAGYGGPAGGGPPPDSGDDPAGHPQRGGPFRRRFGALALVAAVIAGGGAGAVTSALVAHGSTTVAAPPSHLAGSPLALSTNSSSTQAIIAKVEPALVDIHTTGTSVNPLPIFGNGNNPFGGGSSNTAAAGTGMILNSSGLVLTNAHVLEGADAITVTLNGQNTSHSATLVGEDAARDIALIQVKGVSGLPTVSLGDASKVQVGDPVIAIGNALDLQNGGFTASEGIISGLNRSIQTDNSESLTGLVQTSAAISSGDSGGPLVDAAGQVIGMNTAAASSSNNDTASNIGFAIPSNQISSLIGQLQKGSIGQTTTGSAGSGSSGSGSGVYGGYGGFGDGGNGYGSLFG